MSLNVHQVAKSGFGEGTNELYDKVRPSYPPTTLHTVHHALTSTPPSSSSGLTILEPGSGTGIFSRLLLSPPSHEYPTLPLTALIGIEPSSGMRTAWIKGLERLPEGRLRGKEVRAVEGAFDDFSNSEVREKEVDGVVVAQAWHWCPDHGSAFREIAKYLKPSAPLIFIWNIESNDPGWYASIRALLERHDLGTPQYYRQWWRKCFEVPEFEEYFSGKEEGSSEWSLGMTEDQLVDRLLSKSYLTEAHLNGQARVEFITELRHIIREGEKDWIDKDNGVFRYKYDTNYVIMRRKPT